MYFLQLDSLKRDLAARAISEREALPYYLWLGGLSLLAPTLAVGNRNLWDIATDVGVCAVFLVGTVLAYGRNRAAGGHDFFIRYICLSWVVGLRVTLVSVFAALPGVLLEAYVLGEFPEHTTPFETSFVIGTIAILYWRIVVHIESVAETSGPS